MEVAQRYQDALERIKKTVERSYEYFVENYGRYNFFRKFVFQTSLSQDDISLLKFQNKPQLEFNVLPAYVARLRGEFSKQEPSIEVMAGDEEPIDPNTINVVQGHVKHILCEANKDGCEYNVYTDTLSGGFSVLKVWTEYANEKSFNQVIRMGRVFDPVMCGFDPMAQLSHKGDGQFCFEMFPKTLEEFKDEYPDVNIDDFKFVKNVNSFNWSYRGEQQDVVVICDYYEKKKRRVKIMKLANGKTMTKDEYEDFVMKWQESGQIAQPPAVIDERKTEITSICRYRIVENKVLEYVETDYKYLPLVFVDGDSILIRDGVQGAVRQICRPYVFHAKDTQRLKNYAGQCLANELENMVQHKWITPQEALPQQEDYLQAWDNPQIASVLVYKAYSDLQPDQQLPPPREIVRPQIPTEITNTFMLADQLTQTILGSYDAQLGIQQKELSGVAIVEGATQSNSAAMPYIVGFLQALNRVAEIIIDLIPKYYKTPRTIPVVNMKGKKDYVKVNQPQQAMGGMQQQMPMINVMYEENALSVKVEAGVNFAVQKSRALQEIIALMQASPLFAQFMNTEGLEVLLDNIEIRGIDQLKVMTQQWQQQQKQMMQQQMQQQANMPNPAIMKAQTDQAKVQQQMQKDQMQYDIDQKKLQNDILRLQADLEQSRAEAEIQAKKAQTELAVHHVDAALRVHDMRHQHAHDAVRFAHDVQQANKPQPKKGE